jgi:hypothetical protein
VTAGMGIYDAMQLCRAPVQTYCFGLAASMGAFLLGAGARGKRYSMPNSRIMIHQPLGGASGQAVDIEIQVSHVQGRAGGLCWSAQLLRVMATAAACAGRCFEAQRRPAETAADAAVAPPRACLLPHGTQHCQRCSADAWQLYAG